MSLLGISEPIVIAIIVAFIIFIIYVLPMLIRKKNIIDYKNFDWRNSNSFNHFGGIGGPGYHNLKLKEEPIRHLDGSVTLWLESLPRPFPRVNMTPLSKDCNYKIKMTDEAVFGTRIDIYWNIDASGEEREWDNMFVQDWSIYSDRLKKSAKTNILVSQLVEKEFNEELKGLSQDGNIRNMGITPD